MNPDRAQMLEATINRREFLRATGLAGGAAFLAACAPTPSSTGSLAAGPSTTLSPTIAPSESPTPVTINWWNRYGNKVVQTINPPLIEAFNQIYPWITINYDLGGRGAGYEDTLLSNIAAGDPPDVAMLTSTPAEYAARGSLLALDDFMSAAEYATPDAFFEGPMRSCQWKGKTYALPASAGAGAIFLNQAMFDSKGISTKREDFPTTWDELKRLSAEFVERDGDSFRRVGLVPWAKSWLKPVWSGLNGGKLFDAATGRYVIDSEQNAQWLDFWLGWLDEQYGGDIERLNQSGNWSAEGVQSAFALGTAAMHEEGSWSTTDAQLTFEWEVNKYPVGPGGTKSVTGYWPTWFILPSGGQHAKESFQFIEFYTTRGWQIWYATIMDTPAWNDFPPDVVTQALVDNVGLDRAKDIHEFFVDYLADAVDMWNSPVERFASDTLDSAIDEVLHKAKKPAEALAEAQTTAQAKLDETLASA